MKRRLLVGVPFALILGVQLWRPDLSRAVPDPAHALFAAVEAPAEIREIFDRACSDCHSQQTDWPWYSHITPVGQWLVRHVNDGSRHFSLSNFGQYPERRQLKVFHEIAHEVEEGEMPLRSYLWLHGEARLSDSERSAIVNWAKAHAAASEAEPLKGD